jgi:hypothetical protein
MQVTTAWFQNSTCKKNLCYSSQERKVNKRAKFFKLLYGRCGQTAYLDLLVDRGKLFGRLRPLSGLCQNSFAAPVLSVALR